MNGHILGPVAHLAPSDGWSASASVSMNIQMVQSDGDCLANELRTGKSSVLWEYFPLFVVPLSVFGERRSATSARQARGRRPSMCQGTDTTPADAAPRAAPRRPRARRA